MESESTENIQFPLICLESFRCVALVDHLIAGWIGRIYAWTSKDGVCAYLGTVKRQHLSSNVDTTVRVPDGYDDGSICYAAAYSKSY